MENLIEKDLVKKISDLIKSICKSEKNGQVVLNKIESKVDEFLLGLFNKGCFSGDSIKDSYFVICDKDNNKKEDVDEGCVFCDVGISLEIPGEFSVFKFMGNYINDVSFCREWQS